MAQAVLCHVFLCGFRLIIVVGFALEQAAAPLCCVQSDDRRSLVESGVQMRSDGLIAALSINQSTASSLVICSNWSSWVTLN